MPARLMLLLVWITRFENKISDSLHLNDNGNKIITGIIKPVLIKQLGN
jgi:hypothetical protein